MIGFIIPIHPKHYGFIYSLLDVIDTIDTIDIYLVFSNDNDYYNFNKKDKIKKIIIPPTEKNIENCIVTYKKFFALDVLKYDTNYDYFIVCDSEIMIIPENCNTENILNMIHNIFENKIIYAGKVSDQLAIDITRTSCNLLVKDMSDKILETITENYTLYYWWSDLPVYKREHLPHFFSLINYNNMNWYHFDHIIYLSYLILHHNFALFNITYILNHSWSLESYNTQNINDLQILKTINYGFSFITKRLYSNHVDFFRNEKTFLLYHLDR